MKLFVILTLNLLLTNLSWAACTEAPYDQFDFWVGDWQVHTKQGKLAGYNKISADYDNCVIKERYTTPRKYRGESINIYDKGNQQWHQSWVDNTGLLLKLDGNWNGQSMVLTGKQVTEKGEIIHRITWTPKSKTEVHQVWDTSKDNGNSWQTAFYGIYTPKHTAAKAPND